MKRREMLGGIAAALTVSVAGLTARGGTTGLNPAAPDSVQGGQSSKGEGLPDWVPGPGERRSVSLNVLADVDPENPPPGGLGPQAFHGRQGLAAIFKTWNGAVFAPHFSQHGAMVYYGGGHFAYYGTQLSIFDLTSRRWLRINDPVVLPGAKRYQDYDFDYSQDTGSTYWRDHPEICDTNYHDLYGTTPEVQHTYDGSYYLPPGSGGGARGSLLVRARGNPAVHRCDLASGLWSRFSEPSQFRWRGGGTATGCLDPVRGRLWYEGAGLLSKESAIEYLDLQSRQWRIAPGLNRNAYRNRVSHCWSQRNIWLSLSTEPGRDGGQPLGIQLRDLGDDRHLWRAVAVVDDMKRPIRYAAGIDWPTVPAAGIDYCDDDGCFYIYEGQGHQHAWCLEPPDQDIYEAPWVLRKKRFVGAEPTSSGQTPGGLVFSRWKYAKSLKSFVWADHPTQGVQLWRPA